MMNGYRHAYQLLVVLSTLCAGLGAGCVAHAQTPVGDWQDITAEASVAASVGDGEPLDGFSAQVLQDGSVTAASRALAHTNLNAQFQMQFAWCAFESRWEWPQAQPVAAIDLYAADPPTSHAAPVCVKVLAQDAQGEYTIRLYHSENLTWQPAADWQDTQAADQKAQMVRLTLQRPFVTKSLQIIVGHHRTWVELGDVRVWAAPEAPVEPAPARALPREELQLWSANPWAHTQGGTTLPSEGDLAAPWTVSMCRNDTEQAMIGLLNTGQEPGTVTVGVTGMPPGIEAELFALGTVEARGTDAEWWAEGKTHFALVNLFTTEQIASFGGYFPGRFGDPTVWQGFPELTLQPGKPAYVWVKLTTGDQTQPGEAAIQFSADGSQRELTVTVHKVRLPSVPAVDSYPYGGVNDEDSREHHTTVNGGHSRFVTSNLVVHMGKWGTDFVKMAKEDPEGFSTLIREGVDDLHEDLVAQGYRRDQILVEIWDEPNDANIESWLLMAREIKAHDPAALIYSNPPEDWAGHPCTLEKTVAPMAPYVDIWAPHLNLINQFPETLACMKATGKPIWFYQNVGLAYSRNETSPTGWFRTAPWEALRHDLQGVGVWAASSWYGDMWDDFDNTPYVDWPDAAIAFADERGNAISTRNWEAWREGIEDVAIGRMLRLALEKDWLREEDREAARQWLADMPDLVIQHNQETAGRTVAEALAQALEWLDAAWDDAHELDRLVAVDAR